MFVKNDEVVLNVTFHVPEWKCCGFRPVQFHSVCVRRMKYRSSQPASEKMIRHLAYAFQSWPLFGSTRITRYSSRSGTPNTGSSHVRPPVYTADM